TEGVQRVTHLLDAPARQPDVLGGDPRHRQSLAASHTSTASSPAPCRTRDSETPQFAEVDSEVRGADRPWGCRSGCPRPTPSSAGDWRAPEAAGGVTVALSTARPLRPPVAAG